MGQLNQSPYFSFMCLCKTIYNYCLILRSWGLGFQSMSFGHTHSSACDTCCPCWSKKSIPSEADNLFIGPPFYVAQPGLEFDDPPISTSWVLCLQVCAVTPSLEGDGNQSHGLLHVKQTHHQPSYVLSQSLVVLILKNCGLGLKNSQRRGELKENSS